jgi:NACalpha-BTF3-like transcription factor
MAAQPSDDDVAMMMSLTNVSKSEAIARLKV